MIISCSVSLFALYALVAYVMRRLDERERRHLMGLISHVFCLKGFVKSLHEMSHMSTSTIYKGARETLPLVQAAEAGCLFSETCISEIIDGKVGDGFLEDGEGKTYFEQTASPQTDPKVIAMRKPAHRGRPRIHPVNASTKAKKKQRRKGAGAKKYAETHPQIYNDLYHIIEDRIAADPMGNGAWCRMSGANICDQLMEIREDDGTPRYTKRPNKTTILYLLHQMGYSMQRNAKMAPPVEYHKDKDLQFRTIAAVKAIIEKGGVLYLSIDEKKKEDIGNFASAGQELCEIGTPRETETYTFSNGETAIPYGIYDVKSNLAYVTLGISKGTTEFAINCLRDYLKNQAPKTHPGFKTVVITCDGGGNNSSRSRVWKQGLARLASELGITIFVMHYPPYTSKYNAIEHRVFSQISINWSGQPLESMDVMAALIRGTKTRTGLKIECTKDLADYETGKSVSDKVFKRLMSNHVKVFDSNGWNYMIYGRTNPLKNAKSDASAIANVINETIKVTEAKKAAEAAEQAVAELEEKLAAAQERLAEVTKIAEESKKVAVETAEIADNAERNGLSNAKELAALAAELRHASNNKAKSLGRTRGTVSRLSAAKEKAIQEAAALLEAAKLVAAEAGETYPEPANEGQNPQPAVGEKTSNSTDGGRNPEPAVGMRSQNPQPAGEIPNPQPVGKIPTRS